MFRTLFDRLSAYIGLRTSSLEFQTIRVFIARVGALFLGLLSHLALTRWLGISAYGEFTYIIAWVTILTIPSMGIETLVIRETAVTRRRNDEAAFSGLIRWSVLNALCMSGALFLVGFFAVFIASAYSSRELQLAPILGLAAIPLIYIQVHISAVFRGCRRVELAVFLNETVSTGLMATWAGGCLILGVRASASMALGGRLIMLGFILVAFALLLPRLSLPLSLPWQWKAPTREQISTWRKSLFSLVLIKSVNITAGRLPLLMLGFALGPEPVALFSLASRIGGTVMLAFSIVAMTTGPHLAELHAKQDYRRMQRLVTRSALAASVWAIPITLGLIFAGRWLLGWFGPHFVAGYSILVVLAVGYMVNAIIGIVTLVMTMGGLERAVLKVQTLGLIIATILCLALIPVWGALGAAIGSTIALVFWNTILAVQLYRRLGIISSFHTPGFFGRDNAPPDSTEFDNSAEIR